MNRRIFLGMALVVAATPAGAASLSVAEKASLQAAMRQHIDRNLVDGAYLWLDTKSRKIGKLFPGKSHPMILGFGDRYILCTDFRTPDGKDVNVDFYVARKGSGFVIFHAAIDDRATVERLMRDGDAVALA